jgi:hypothetical protein
LRTPGRGLVLEGPSGIGKSTAVSRALTDMAIQTEVLNLSARRIADLEYIESLPSTPSFGTVIVDDFHGRAPIVPGQPAALIFDRPPLRSLSRST